MQESERTVRRTRNKASLKAPEASDTLVPRATRQLKRSNAETILPPKRRRLKSSRIKKAAESVSKELVKGSDVEPQSEIKTPTIENNDSDDSEFPSILSASPSGPRKRFQKYDVVWVKYKQVYWPCLITAVCGSYVRYKFVNDTRKRHVSYRAYMRFIKRFDDPELNASLLKEGREIHPEIQEAYDRVVNYYIHLSNQKSLSPLKFLTYDKVADLLYGILSEDESGPSDTKDDHSSLTEVASNVTDESHENPGTSEDEKTFTSVDDSFSNNYDIGNDRDNQDQLKECNLLLHLIESDDCFKFLKNACVKSAPSERFNLFLQNKEFELMCESGLGPFSHVNNPDITDKLFDFLENHLKKLLTSKPYLKKKDCSLLLRHVLMPEAIIFAIQRHFNFDRDKAEQFYKRTTMGKDDEAEQPCEQSRMEQEDKAEQFHKKSSLEQEDQTESTAGKI